MARAQTVIIDEAAQAVEPSSLIPLARAPRCVMVGDPKQLPATIMFTGPGEASYQQSLFERLQTADLPTRTLTTQYRMHPAICAFPSRDIYNGARDVRASCHGGSGFRVPPGG